MRLLMDIESCQVVARFEGAGDLPLGLSGDELPQAVFALDSANHEVVGNVKGPAELFALLEAIARRQANRYRRQCRRWQVLGTAAQVAEKVAPGETVKIMAPVLRQWRGRRRSAADAAASQDS